MKLMIIRHGDPDYATDSLTEVGKIEAELLVPRMEKLDVKAFYVSPLGRAQQTAAPTLQKLGREAVTLPWLREFPIRVKRPGIDEVSIVWDWLPAEWTKEPRFFDRDAWMDVELFRKAGVREEAQKVFDGLDQLLADHGYIRDGYIYRAEEPNEDTIVLFCHFGLGCLLLSRILNISPMLLWHGTCATPTSVTTLVTEERREGIAYFRMLEYGDTSHLYAADRRSSFMGRFCETYANGEQRH